MSSSQRISSSASVKLAGTGVVGSSRRRGATGSGAGEEGAEDRGERGVARAIPDISSSESRLKCRMRDISEVGIDDLVVGLETTFMGVSESSFILMTLIAAGFL